jgi:hypothetical protein
MRKQNMALTAAIVRQEFDLTRVFYKNGYKSSNKVYRPTGPNSAGVTHFEKREQGQREAHERISDLREMLSQYPMRPADVAEFIIDNVMRWGNCSEMAQLMSGRLLRHDCKPSRVYLAKVETPGDHAFTLISLDGRPPVASNVLRLGALDGANFWAADPWMNVCCQINEYKNLCLIKLRKWSVADKRIFYRNVWTDPLNYTYVASFMTGPLAFCEY